MVRQHHSERLMRRGRGGGLLLKHLNFAAFKRVHQPALFFFEVLFRINATINRERTKIRRHVEICARLDAPSEQKDGLSRRGRSNLLLCLTEFHFLLKIEKLRYCRHRPLEGVHTLKVATYMRRLPAHCGAQRNAPRLAFQTMPPVGSGVSMPIASLPRTPRAARSRDPRGPAVSSSGTKTI